MAKEKLLYNPKTTQCRAALLALKETYPKKWQQWLDFRMELLTKLEPLKCEYCGRENLKKVTEGVSKKDQATLDHVKPLSKGGARYDESNLVVACRPCNEKKGDKW